MTWRSRSARFERTLSLVINFHLVPCAFTALHCRSAHNNGALSPQAFALNKPQQKAQSKANNMAEKAEQAKQGRQEEKQENQEKRDSKKGRNGGGGAGEIEFDNPIVEPKTDSDTL